MITARPIALLLTLSLISACGTTPAPPPVPGPPAEDEMSAVERVTTPPDQYDWVKVVLILAAPADQTRRRAARRALSRVLKTRGVKHRLELHHGKLVLGLSSARKAAVARVQRLVDPTHLFAVRPVDDDSDLPDRIAALDPSLRGDVRLMRRGFHTGDDERAFVDLWSPGRATLKRLLTRLPEAQRPADDHEFVLGPQNNGVIPGHAAYLLWRKTVVGGADVAKAAVQHGGDGVGPSVSITLDPAAGERFAEATQGWLNKRLAVVVRGRVETVPVVREVIRGGKLSISLDGRGTVEAMRHQAADLALLLDNAAELATLQLEEVVFLSKPAGPRATTL